VTLGPDLSQGGGVARDGARALAIRWRMAGRPWSRAAREERQWRAAFALVRAEERGACRELLAAVVEQAVLDLRTATSGPLEDALLYLLEDAGEFAWHAAALDLDPGAVRARARALLAERFGPEAGAALEARCSLVARGRRRRRAA